jgi:GAF domain-containing protein
MGSAVRPPTACPVAAGYPADPQEDTMARFRVDPQAADATFSLEALEAEDWTAALGDVLDQLGLGSEAVHEVVCTIRGDGGVSVAAGGADLLLVPLDEVDELPSIDITPVLAARSVPPREAAVPLITAELGRAAHAGLHALDTALGGVRSGAQDSGAALEALLGVVPAESAAVLWHAPEASVLRFVAARGPRAAGLLGVELPDGAGIAGLVQRSAVALRVHDAGVHPSHYDAVDRTTGYRTRAIIAVPIGPPGGTPLGVLELLNPVGGVAFAAWHVQAANRVAARLGA